MTRFLKVLFFKLFAFAKRGGNKRKSDATFTSLLLVSLTIDFNIISIFTYLECFLWHRENLIRSNIFLFFILISVPVFIYSYLRYDKRFDALFLEYKEDIRMSGRQGTWLSIFYILFTLCLFISLFLRNCI